MNFTVNESKGNVPILSTEKSIEQTIKLPELPPEPVDDKNDVEEDEQYYNSNVDDDASNTYESEPESIKCNFGIFGNIDRPSTPNTRYLERLNEKPKNSKIKYGMYGAMGLGLLFAAFRA